MFLNALANAGHAELPAQSVQSQWCQTLSAAGAFGVGECILPTGCSQQCLKAQQRFVHPLLAQREVLQQPNAHYCLSKLCVPLGGAGAAQVRRSCREPGAIHSCT